MEKRYILYRTVNQLTGHYYIGVHGQFKDDSYLGSGIHLKRQLAKYGRENFTRSTLSTFQFESEAFAAEIKMLQEHLGQPLCLNISRGGDGGANFKKLEGAARTRRDAKSQALKDARKRNCTYCEAEFTAKRKSQLYCSRICVKRSNSAKATVASMDSQASDARRAAISLKMKGNQNGLGNSQTFRSKTTEEVAELSRLSAHNRWHVAREIISEKCGFCREPD